MDSQVAIGVRGGVAEVDYRGEDAVVLIVDYDDLEERGATEEEMDEISMLVHRGMLDAAEKKIDEIRERDE